MSKLCLVDTNILLRFFTGEPPALADRARVLVEQADLGKLQLGIASLIVAEIVYTLESFYSMGKADVCEKLGLFLRSRGIAPDEPEIILDALERYRAQPVHFADAYLAAFAAANKQRVYSFDKDFRQVKDVEWSE
jgi:predicted nucleic acid-binding protein